MPAQSPSSFVFLPSAMVLRAAVEKDVTNITRLERRCEHEDIWDYSEIKRYIKDSQQLLRDPKLLRDDSIVPNIFEVCELHGKLFGYVMALLVPQEHVFIVLSLVTDPSLPREFRTQTKKTMVGWLKDLLKTSRQYSKFKVIKAAVRSMDLDSQLFYRDEVGFTCNQIHYEAFESPPDDAYLFEWCTHEGRG